MTKAKMVGERKRIVTIGHHPSDRIAFPNTERME